MENIFKNSSKMVALWLLGLTFWVSSCNKEEPQPEENVTEIQEVAVNSAGRVENSTYGQLWAIPNGWIGKNGGNITSPETPATCTVKIKNLRQDFTYYPTIYVQVGTVNIVAAYRQNGKLIPFDKPRTNVGLRTEASPFKINRRNLPSQIDNDEIIFIATRASNVNVARVEFRIYRDYTNNPLWWTSGTPDNKLDGTGCVRYIRGKITTLSSTSVRLNWYSEKKAIVNVRDDNGNLTKDLKFVRKGMAVIMPVHKSQQAIYGNYGHIAYVSEVHSDGSITITEGMEGANFSTRRGYPDKRQYQYEKGKWRDGFDVYGYYHPNP